MNKELIDRNSIGTQLCEGLACCECSFGKEFDRCMLEERLKELPTERAIPEEEVQAIMKAVLDDSVSRGRIEKMIEEIEQLRAWNAYEEPMKNYVLSIVHKYCNKENKDGSNNT